jgi:GYF domain 2
MAEWYYVQNGQRQGPVSSEDLKQLTASGAVGPDDLVWKNGMANWVRAATVGGLSFAGGGDVAPAVVPAGYVPVAGTAPLGYYEPAGKGEVNLTRRAMEMLRQTKPWARFVSIMLYIVAALFTGGGIFFAVIVSSQNLRGPAAAIVAPALVYVAFGSLFVVAAIFLGRYASGIRDLLASPQDQHLNAALEAQKSFWKFVGITMAVVVGIYAIILLFVLVAFVVR